MKTKYLITLNIIISLFISIISIIIFLRICPVYPISNIIVDSDENITTLSNFYQLIITILTILLGVFSFVTFFHSKNAAENTMHDLVNSKIDKIIQNMLHETLKNIYDEKKVSEEIKKIYQDNFEEIYEKKYQSLQNQIDDLIQKIDELQE